MSTTFGYQTIRWSFANSLDPGAQPNDFYFDVESVGTLGPNTIVDESIKALKLKLASVVSELTGATDGDRDYESRDPVMNGANGANEMTMDHGFTTPGYGGGASAWGGGVGSSTPFPGATPFGAAGPWS